MDTDKLKDGIKAQLKRAEDEAGEQVHKAQAIVDEARATAKAHFGKDKLQHFIGGCVVVASAFLVLATAQYDTGFSIALATTLVGLGWEFIQKFRGEGTFSLLDAAATAAPGYAVWATTAYFGLY